MTIDCPWCRGRTSVYAVLFKCYHCGRRLEAPSSLAGLETDCPQCKKDLLVPRDVLHKQHEAWMEGTWLRISCPDCAQPWIANQRDTGTWAVCPYCLNGQVVPPAGEPVAGAAAEPAPDPFRSLGLGPDVHCPHCRCRIPARAANCPMCAQAVS